MKDILPAPGYEGLYSITANGVVVSYRPLPFKGRARGEIALKSRMMTSGYLYVTLCDGKRMKNRSIHRMVCEAFNGPSPSGRPHVNHIDGNKTNNRADNLEWVSRSENALHAYRLGLIRSRPMKGCLNHNSILDEAKVREIRERNASGVTQLALSKVYGCSPQAINAVCTRKNWSHVS